MIPRSHLRSSDETSPTGSAGSSGRPLIGLDIGGTKCAVSVWRDGRVVEVERLPTSGFAEMFPRLAEAVGALADGREPDIGISCGGPLDAAAGVILDPPNLPADWHHVEIVRLLREHFGGRAVLMNDANACALAEWRFGAGRGCRSLVFLTSGTGMGAGLILDGRLYEGASGDAGEIGHVRLRAGGPRGYGKDGSVEGFCSGGGIARWAALRAAERGGPTVATTTRELAEAARAGDAFARELLHDAGERLGETIAIFVDILNPERVVVGGFYPKCREFLDTGLFGALRREALAGPAARCEVMAGSLGETIGSHGAIAAAWHAWGGGAGEGNGA